MNEHALSLDDVEATLPITLLDALHEASETVVRSATDLRCSADDLVVRWGSILIDESELSAAIERHPSSRGWS